VQWDSERPWRATAFLVPWIRADVANDDRTITLSFGAEFEEDEVAPEVSAEFEPDRVKVSLRLVPVGFNAGTYGWGPNSDRPPNHAATIVLSEPVAGRLVVDAWQPREFPRADDDRVLSESLRSALTPLIADVEATAGIEIRFVGNTWAPADYGESFYVFDASGSGQGVALRAAASNAEALAEAADGVQEQVVEGRWHAGLPTAWPECPLHRSHPLDATVQRDRAVWACPKEPSFSVPIGEVASVIER
jgi:hypothetical protein